MVVPVQIMWGVVGYAVVGVAGDCRDVCDTRGVAGGIVCSALFVIGVRGVLSTGSAGT